MMPPATVGTPGPSNKESELSVHIQFNEVSPPSSPLPPPSPWFLQNCLEKFLVKFACIVCVVSGPKLHKLFLNQPPSPHVFLPQSPGSWGGGEGDWTQVNKSESSTHPVSSLRRDDDITGKGEVVAK